VIGSRCKFQAIETYHLAPALLPPAKINRMASAQAHHDGPLDRDHLRRMSLGDLALEREVLTMFLAQAGRLVDTLATQPADASALVHTLKGSARAIGAFGVADHAAVLEAELQKGEGTSEALAALRDAVADARAAIGAVLKNSQSAD
jgi:HPt (histidine-containing phosphotransfer) domain-containing protein